MTGLMILERLHVKTWVTVCKSNLCQSLQIHGKVNIPLNLAVFKNTNQKQKAVSDLALLNSSGSNLTMTGVTESKWKVPLTGDVFLACMQ